MDLRVLVLSNNAFSEVHNNGKTYASLLDTIPADNLAQLYFGSNEYPDLKMCNRYYRINESDIVRSLMNFSFKATNSHNKLVESLQKQLNSKDNNIYSYLKKNNKTFACFREILWNLKTWDTIDLHNWIQKFRPNIIFAVLGDCIFVHKIALFLSEKYNLPLIVYYTDDYYINNNTTNLLQRLHYNSLRKQYTITNRKASLLYAIGKEMANAYSKVFSRDFGVLINSIDFESLKINAPIVINRGDEIFVSYIGGLHLNRWKTIAKLGKIFKTINDNYGYRLMIKVFTVDKPEASVLNTFSQIPVKYCGKLSKNEVYNEFSVSHFLLHVESFDEIYRTYTRFSISTKIPEYLSSNRGILVYGPSEVSSVKIFSENHLGVVLTDEQSDTEIVKIILNAISSYNTYDFNNQFMFAYKYFDKKVIADSLKNDMLKIINS